MNEKWKVSDMTKAEYIGLLEIEDKKGDFNVFAVFVVPGDRYVFGGMCNAGFMESGYMFLEGDEGELTELHGQLQSYYDDGPQYAPRLVCNDRM